MDIDISEKVVVSLNCNGIIINNSRSFSGLSWEEAKKIAQVILQNQPQTRVFYHEKEVGIPCPDGIASAWVCRRKFSDSGAVYVPCLHQSDELPEVNEGDRIYVVDFSFPAEVIEKWILMGCDVTIIDHHQNKMEELLGRKSLEDIIVFDNSRSGATLCWRYFFPDEPMPAFLPYIEDRDLFRKQLPWSNEVHYGVIALGRNFETFDKLAPMNTDQLIGYLAPIGQQEYERQLKIIEEFADCAVWQDVAGYRVPVTLISLNEIEIASDICAFLYKRFPEAPFSAYRYLKNGVENWGLRSNQKGNNFDVSAIARQFGGNGHRNASGFKK